MADALFPRVRQRVLGILYGNPDRSFFAREIMALAQSGAGAVQRELADLAAAGLLKVSTQGNQKHYQANEAAPVYAELRGLVLKTFGLTDVLRNALAPVAARIEAAFVFGSVAKGEDTAASDIDVMIAGDGAKAALEAAARVPGVTRVIHVPGAQFDQPTAEGIAAQVLALVNANHYTHVLAAATGFGAALVLGALVFAAAFLGATFFAAGFAAFFWTGLAFAATVLVFTGAAAGAATAGATGAATGLAAVSSVAASKAFSALSILVAIGTTPLCCSAQYRSGSAISREKLCGAQK